MFLLLAIHIYPDKSGELKGLCCGWLLVMCIVAAFSHGVKSEMSFAHYGSDTFSAIKLHGGELIYIDCPDYYDAADLSESVGCEKACLVLSDNLKGEAASLLQSRIPETVIASDALLSDKEKLEIRESAGKGVRTIFLKDSERICVSGAWIEYFPIGNIEGRAVRVEYEDCVFVSLQGIDVKETQKLLEADINIKCDYLKIPYRIAGKGADFSSLTDGRVLFGEKGLTVR